MIPAILLLQVPTVTIRPKVARIEAHLQEFVGSKPHRADKSVAGDTLAIRFDKVEAPKARAILAEALRAQWREEKDAWILYRTPETLKAFAEEEFALREASIRAGQAAATAEANAPFDAASVAARINAAQNETGIGPTDGLQEGPIGRLATRLSSHFEPSVAARLPVYGRVTFADQSPTKLQRPMTEAMRKAVQTYWTEVAEVRKRIDYQVLGTKQGIDWVQSGVGNPGNQKPGKTLFELWRGDFGLELRVWAHDADGWLVSRGRHAFRGVATTPTRVPDIPNVTLQAPVAPTVGLRDPAGPEWQMRFRDPVAVDPLDWVWGEFIRGIAQKSDATICLWFTDRDVPSDDAVEFKPQMQALVNGGYTLRFSNNELVGTPNRIASKRTNSVSRFALRDFAMKCSLFQGPDIPVVANFFRAAPNGVERVIGRWFQAKTGRFLTNHERPVVLFLDSLPVGARPAVGKEFKFTRKDLSPASYRALMLIGDVNPRHLQDQPSEDDRFGEGSVIRNGNANGLMIYNRPTLEWKTFEPMYLGAAMAFLDQPKAFPANYMSALPDAYFGSWTSWELVALREPDPVGMRGMVYSVETRAWSADRRVGFEELPEEVRKKVLEVKEEVLKAVRSPVTGGDGRVPPPFEPGN